MNKTNLLFYEPRTDGEQAQLLRLQRSGLEEAHLRSATAEEEEGRLRLRAEDTADRLRAAINHQARESQEREAMHT